jgi:hypothetical protein
MTRAAYRRSFWALAVCQPWVLQAQFPPVHHKHDLATFENAGVSVRPVEGSPLYVRLENHSGRSINLVTLRYAKRYRDGSGKVVFSIPQIPFGAIGNRASGFQNGTSKVVGPGGGDPKLEFSALRYDDIAFSVDSIVFDDRVVVGPNVFDVVQQDRERNRAERAVLEGLLSRLGQGKQESVAWLESVIADHAGLNPTTGQPDFYKAGAVGIAISLKSLLDTMPVERVSQATQSLLDGKLKYEPLHH